MAKVHDSVQGLLSGVGDLVLEDAEDALLDDALGVVDDGVTWVVDHAESGVDECGTELFDLGVGFVVGGAEDLDEFGDTVADLRLGNGAQKGAVDDGGDGLVVAADAVLEAVKVDGDPVGYRVVRR